MLFSVIEKHVVGRPITYQISFNNLKTSIVGYNESVERELQGVALDSRVDISDLC